MKNHSLLSFAAIALAAGLWNPSLRAAHASQSVFEIAAGADDFSILFAGLVETLSGDGPFTIFAPTNEAFAKLTEGTVESLLKPENKEKLAAILTDHVVAGKVMAANVKPGKEATIEVKGASVMVDAAKVVKTDLVGKNGDIHVIDSVILPE